MTGTRINNVKSVYDYYDKKINRVFLLRGKSRARELCSLSAASGGAKTPFVVAFLPLKSSENVPRKKRNNKEFF